MEGKTGQNDGLKPPSIQCLVWATAANHWVGRKPQTVSEMAAPTWSEHQRAPGLYKEPTKSADGSEAKGYWLWRISVTGRHVDP